MILPNQSPPIERYKRHYHSNINNGITPQCDKYIIDFRDPNRIGWGLQCQQEQENINVYINMCERGK